MLVLTRKYGEKIMIGDDIVITIMEGRGDGVRIGIEAPAGVSVKRAEVYAAVLAENLAAAGADSADEAGLRDSLTRIAPTAAPEPGAADGPALQ